MELVSRRNRNLEGFLVQSTMFGYTLIFPQWATTIEFGNTFPVLLFVVKSEI